MRAVELSGERVADRLGALEEAYAPFPVNQTTLSVSEAAYERARERCAAGFADVYVQVYNGADEVLLVEHDGEWVVPHAEPARSERLEGGTRRALAEQTGVECRLTALERVTILGVRHEDDPQREPVYRLVAVFAAERTGGAPQEGVAWHADLPESALPGQ